MKEYYAVTYKRTEYGKATGVLKDFYVLEIS